MKKLFLFVVILIYCAFTFSQTDTAIVKGKVYSANLKLIAIKHLKDNPILGYVFDTYTALLNDNGEFTLKIPVNKLATGKITTGRFEHDICLLPNDNFYIDITPDSFKYVGQGAEKNNFLFDIEQKGYNESIYFKNNSKKMLAPQDFAFERAKIKDTRNALLYHYSKYNEIEQAYKDYFIAENQSRYMLSIINYPWHYTYKKKIKVEALKLPDVYNVCKQIKNVVDDNNVISGTYLLFIKEMIYNKAADLRREQLFNQKPYESYHLIMTDSLKGRTQEYAMAAWLCEQLSYDNVDTFIYEKFNNLVKDSLALNTVSEAFQLYYRKQAMIGKPLNDIFYGTRVIDDNQILMSLGSLMEKYKGQVIYLNIGSPTKTSLEHRYKLQRKLKDKPVKFIYLNVGTISKREWDRKYKQYVGTGEHYSLLDLWDAKILKSMRIAHIPQYIIIDKEGKLVAYNAPHPENEGLEEQLIKLME